MVRWLALAFGCLVLIPILLTPLYAFVDPPLSAVMIEKRLGGAGIERTWTGLGDISPNLIRAVMMSEDARFCEHGGVDFVEMRAAWDHAERGGTLRGASTITMQTVKNLFLWTGRDWVRKALEAPLALYADFILPKRRIMEIYLNIVEWDTGVYGAGAAAQHFFNVSPARLTAAQASRMAVTLPAPEVRDAAKPGPGMAMMARRVSSRAAMAGPYDDCVISR